MSRPETWKESFVEVRLSPEHERFVRRCVANGRFASAADTVEAALRMLEGNGQSNTLQRAVALGMEQTVAGRSSAFTVDDVKGRAFRRKAPR